MNMPLMSFVIPVMNEEATLAELLARIETAVRALDRPFEVIFVDDGSTDESWLVIRSLALQRHDAVRGLRFRRNLGKAAALAEGFRAARGSVVFTLDADLQDDPQEIGRFLEKLEEGYDIVSGWKKVRHDPWHKVIPSRVFNAMLSALSKTHLHDHNCGFKCYRADVVKEIVLYGEMHRMVPALGTMHGFRSAEIAVRHHPRRFGKSKYGVKRFLRGFMDMLTVAFLQNFRERPLHFMGGMALSLACVGGAVSVVGVVTGPFGVPMTIVGATLAGTAVPLLGLGFVSELLVNTMSRMRARPAIVEEAPRRGEAPLAQGSSALVEAIETPPSSVRERALAMSRAANKAAI
jgi:dolichol-phosphate mannosyltransferase